MGIHVFLDVTCRWVRGSRHFEGPVCLHLEGSSSPKDYLYFFGNHSCSDIRILSTVAVCLKAVVVSTVRIHLTVVVSTFRIHSTVVVSTVRIHLTVAVSAVRIHLTVVVSSVRIHLTMVVVQFEFT